MTTNIQPFTIRVPVGTLRFTAELDIVGGRDPLLYVGSIVNTTSYQIVFRDMLDRILQVYELTLEDDRRLIIFDASVPLSRLLVYGEVDEKPPIIHDFDINRARVKVRSVRVDQTASVNPVYDGALIVFHEERGPLHIYMVACDVDTLQMLHSIVRPHVKRVVWELNTIIKKEFLRLNLRDRTFAQPFAGFIGIRDDAYNVVEGWMPLYYDAVKMIGSEIHVVFGGGTVEDAARTVEEYAKIALMRVPKHFDELNYNRTSLMYSQPKTLIRGHVFLGYWIDNVFITSNNYGYRTVKAVDVIGGKVGIELYTDKLERSTATSILTALTGKNAIDTASEKLGKLAPINKALKPVREKVGFTVVRPAIYRDYMLKMYTPTQLTVKGISDTEPVIPIIAILRVQHVRSNTQSSILIHLDATMNATPNVNIVDSVQRAIEDVVFRLVKSKFLPETYTVYYKVQKLVRQGGYRIETSGSGVRVVSKDRTVLVSYSVKPEQSSITHVLEAVAVDSWRGIDRPREHHVRVEVVHNKFPGLHRDVGLILLREMLRSDIAAKVYPWAVFKAIVKYGLGQHTASY